MASKGVTTRMTETFGLRPEEEAQFAGRWAAGVGGGLAGGIAFGALLQATGGLPTIGALYGAETLVGGWVAHLFHSLLFGLAFAGLSTAAPFRQYAARVLPAMGLGIAYGVSLWLVLATVVMPLWLTAMGLQTPIGFDLVSLVGHVGFGAVLGATFPAFLRATRPTG
ncbi:hypothetical protein [Natronomonas sp. EA1]|uniref:hypothetical protein n=1 Tax=Natronomonas sp. EA1 TaxID=3421655 RepID=UPI003EB6DAF4